MSTSRRFLILHGVENWRPREHWQWWLAEQLRSCGEQVLYPQLPSPSSPALDQWLAVLHGELAQLGTGERIVIAHSCSVALWLSQRPRSPARSASIASPSSRHQAHPRSSRPTAFLPVGIDRAAVTRASKAPAILVSSDNDPYCPEGLDAYKSIFTDDLEMEHQVLRGAGHISVDEGYGPWPAILKWCTSGLSDWTSQTQHGDNQAGNEPKQTDPADSYSPLKFGLDG